MDLSIVSRPVVSRPVIRSHYDDAIKEMNHPEAVAHVAASTGQAVETVEAVIQEEAATA